MKENEILDKLQEECAEIICVCSKIRRFGWDNHNPFVTPIKTNRSHLIEEVGDVLAVIDILIEHYELSSGEISDAKLATHAKLRKWTTIFENPVLKDDDGIVFNKINGVNKND
jgi:NTP pyrophosphatase (non-canonical NTP hydrolase)